MRLSWRKPVGIGGFGGGVLVVGSFQATNGNTRAPVSEKKDRCVGVRVGVREGVVVSVNQTTPAEAR